MKHQRLIKGVRAILEEEYGSEESERMADRAQGRYLQLCRENHNDSKALKQHTFTRIYPAVVEYETLRKYGISQEKAVWYVREYFIRFAADTVPYLQKLISLTHTERIIPALFQKLPEKGFPPEAGFAYVFPPKEKTQARFNILSCPYMKTCQKYGCPELCTAFCDGDDTGYGNLHRNLRWGRTKTIGRGDDCCNFLLKYVRDTER